MDKKPIIWSYVVAYDEGSAPCVDNNLLTLCICKPLIRRGANIGDWIIGFAKKKIGQNLITYVAEITEKISMEEYFLDSSKRLDKIYNVVDNKMVHYGGDIHNSPRNWKTDINGKYCLISQNFWYFGKDHRSNPEELYELYYPYVGQKKIINPEELNKLKNYMNGIENGVHSHPKDMTIYLNPIVKKIKKDIQLLQSNLGDEYFYNSLSLCIIDAVFSMGVRYTSTENTVKKYCNFFKLQTFRDRDDKRFPNHKNQDTVENLISQIEDLSISKFTEQVFNNKQRTSTKSGILKTEAVLMFAKVLVDSGISSFKDIDKLFKSEIVEKRIKEIPGQNSGISFKYFLMLSGNDKLIKPDRMIIRYVEEIVGFKLDEKVTIKLIQDAAKILNKEFPNINSRSLDHEIWKYQKNL